MNEPTEKKSTSGLDALPRDGTRCTRPIRPGCNPIFPLFLLCFTWTVASTCAGAEDDPQFGGKPVSQWIEVARSDTNPERRRKAAFAFRMLGTEARQAVPALIALLQDSDDRVREAAARALGKVGSGRLKEVAALVESLDDEHPSVVEAAAASLGEFGPAAQPAIEDLIEVTDRFIDLSVPVESLCGIGEPAFKPLVRVLMDAQRPERLRIHIATVLPRYGEPAVEPLAELAWTASPALRSKALYGLGMVGPVAKEVVPTLIEAMQAPNSDVRLAAAYAIGECGPEAKAAIPVLIDALDDADRRVGDDAADALAAMEAELEPFIPQLIECLLEEDAFARHHAAKVIGTVGPAAQSAVPALVEMLREHRRVDTRRAGDDRGCCYPGSHPRTLA